MEGEPIEDEFSLRSNESRDYPIPGMGSVVATVSGYHGSERFKLIKLINQSGANYIGAMSKSTTHLVCWRFEGRKYELAKNFGTIVVGHHWFVDCAKEGKRLPERHYIMQSGQQAGPLLWEVPVVGEKESLLTRKKGNVFSDRSNMCNDTRALKIDKGCARRGSCLLTENLFPDSGTNDKNFHKIKKTVGQKSSRQDCRWTNKDCSLEKPLSGLVRVQHEESSSYSPMLSARHKRSVCSAVGSTTTIEPTRKGRRLVKKNASRDILESATLNCKQDCSSTGIFNRLNNITALSNDSDDLRDCSQTEICNRLNITAASNDIYDLRNENALSPQGTPLEDDLCNGQNRNELLEDVEDITELNNITASNGSNILSEDALPTRERTSQNGFSDFEENMDGVLKDVGEFGERTGLPSSTELSCVICWTDFSSTRGVLPCGHRFCYSCIQGWSDHMASRRKVSTCPLCKASFVSITKVDGAASSDQKIYSQTIPFASSATDIFVLPDWEISSFRAQSSAASVCCECRSREPEDLLISCRLCRSGWIHSYCLDPPLVPWTCLNCRDLRMLYHRIH